MAKQASPKQNKGDRALDRKNGKAWKKVDGGARQRKTGRTGGGYKISRLSEWSDLLDAAQVLSNTKFHAVMGRERTLAERVARNSELV